jgi:hypothetical protein
VFLCSPRRCSKVAAFYCHIHWRLFFRAFPEGLQLESGRKSPSTTTLHLQSCPTGNLAI